LASNLRFLCPETRWKESGLLDDGTHLADHFIDGQRNLVIEDSDVAGVRGDEPEKHPNRRCFPEPLGPKNAWTPPTGTRRSRPSTAACLPFQVR
jgi:hypothetical protein